MRTLCAILKKEGDSYFMPSVASAGDKSVVHKSLSVVLPIARRICVWCPFLFCNHLYHHATSRLA